MSFNLHKVRYTLHVKIQLFVSLKTDQDPDPHGSSLILLPGSGSSFVIKSWMRTMRIRYAAIKCLTRRLITQFFLLGFSV
jgi:hypothetical protein